MESKQINKKPWLSGKRSQPENFKTLDSCPVEKMEEQIKHNYRQRLKTSLCYALLVGFVGALLITFAIRPMERTLIHREAQLAAMGLLTAVKSRGSVMDAVTVSKSENDLVSPMGLENISSILRSKFDDFLTLEIINHKGEILAAVGALNRTQSPLESRVQTVRYKILEKERHGELEVFRDFPNKDYYSITRGKTSENGAVFYIRARFARQSLESALTIWSLSDAQDNVQIVPITGDVTNLREKITDNYLPDVKIRESIFWGPVGAEAIIFSNRWIISLSGHRGWGIIYLAMAMLLTGLLSNYVLYIKQKNLNYSIKEKSKHDSYNANEDSYNRSALDIKWNSVSAKPGRRFTLDLQPMVEFNESDHLSPKSQAPDEDLFGERLVIDLEDLDLFAESNYASDFKDQNQMVEQRPDDQLEETAPDFPEANGSSNAFIEGNPGIWAEPSNGEPIETPSEHMQEQSLGSEGLSIDQDNRDKECDKQEESLLEANEHTTLGQWRQS